MKYTKLKKGQTITFRDDLVENYSYGNEAAITSVGTYLDQIKGKTFKIKEIHKHHDTAFRIRGIDWYFVIEMCKEINNDSYKIY